MWQLWLVIISVALTWLWKKWGANYIKMWSYLRNFPGPRMLPIIGNILDIGLSSSVILYKSLDLWRQYGFVFRVWIGPEPTVVLTDPRDIEVVLSDVKYIDKGFIYSFIEPWLGTGLLTSTGAKWHKHRKIITPTFHFKILEQFVEIFNKQGDALISKLQEEVGKGVFDVSTYIDLYTHDVICETAMGVNMKSQKQDKRSSRYVRAVHRQTYYIMQRIMRPWLYLDSLFSFSILGRKQRRSLSVLHGTTEQVIAERRKILKNSLINIQDLTADDSGIKKRFAFLDLLLLTSENGKVLSDTDIREEVDTFMFEGHDTTSTGICFTLFELARNKEIQDRLFEELENIMGHEYSVTLDKLNDMKYLDRVVKEGLRLYPSVPIFFRKLKYSIPLTTRNMTVPAGCTVSIAPFAVHRHPEFFPDAEKFNPDNFMPDRTQGRHAFAYIPFSGGSRNCIGQKFAMLELKSVISKIIWNYEVLPDVHYEPKFTIGLTLKTSNGVMLKMVPRKRNIN